MSSAPWRSVLVSEGAPTFPKLTRALNGLHIRARAFKGTWTDGENSRDLVMACYVDDFLIVSSHPKAEEFAQSMLRTRVETVKITGHIPANQAGQLVFWGREIERFDAGCSLFVRIPVSFFARVGPRSQTDSDSPEH